MTMTMWDPFTEMEQALEQFRREMWELWNEATQSSAPMFRIAFLPSVSARRYPLVNLAEDAEAIYVEALAPGVDPESLNISISGDTLRIEGEKSPINAEIKPEAFHRSERGSGRFTRTVTLPSAVESDKVKAEYKNGLLTIMLPKAMEAKPKRIPVSLN